MPIRRASAVRTAAVRRSAYRRFSHPPPCTTITVGNGPLPSGTQASSVSPTSPMRANSMPDFHSPRGSCASSAAAHNSMAGNTSLLTRRCLTGSPLLLPPRARFRQRLARQHLGTRSGVIDKAGHHGGRLLQITALNTIVGIHVGVVCPRLVLDWILNELEARQPDSVEGKMIRACRVADRQCRHALILERLHP